MNDLSNSLSSANKEEKGEGEGGGGRKCELRGREVLVQILGYGRADRQGDRTRQ